MSLRKLENLGNRRISIASFLTDLSILFIELFGTFNVSLLF